MPSTDTNEDSQETQDPSGDSSLKNSSASKASGASEVGGLSSILLRLMGVKAADGRIILVSYPKIIFLYPTVVISLICGIIMSIMGGVTEIPAAPSQVSQQMEDGSANNADNAAATSSSSETGDPDTAANNEAEQVVLINRTAEFCGRFFLFALLVNLVVIGFDFPRTASFTIFFGGVALAALVYSLVRMNESVLPALVTGLVGIKPVANSTFYYAFFLGMTVMYGAVAVTRRFDYWEVSGNELLHHQGFLSNLKRYPSPNLRIDKEINDVFEFILLRSGRLILQPSNERKAIVLENVVNISRKEERISSMLKQLDVRVS